MIVRKVLMLCFLILVTSHTACAKPAPRTSEEQETIEVYKRVNKSVVFITTVTLTVDPFDLFASVKPQEGSGSGIIIDAQRGIIITNLHVIQDAHKIEIQLADRAASSARLLGYDREYDIAVLQLDQPPSDLVELKFGNSSELDIGQRVLAIGNPFGLNRTLTTGIISSLNRTVRGAGGILMRGLIQTDAAINPGNSGGPLLDAAGKLIGINTAILSQSGDSAGIGFAVPINQLKRILPDLISTGRVRRAKVGWILVDTAQGPMVRRVMQGGPAARAGVQPIERAVSNVFLRGYIRDFDRADIILKVNGKPVYSREEIDEVVANNGPDKSIVFVIRQAKPNSIERTVSIKPELQ